MIMDKNPIRELSAEELMAVSGGVGFTLTLGHPLGGLPPFSIMFDGNVGSITFNGMTLPIGVGSPPFKLP